ncbi:metallophosphoesterase [Paracoccus sp. SSK6]|uniref:metallophosphoesterase family protein n=1 Tax=Paracoccus sp. SSK6 TaxID=3143131 RepID=UPI00321AADA6
MPETYREFINRILRDHEGGDPSTYPMGDRSTARKPIYNRDLREAFLAGETATESATQAAADAAAAAAAANGVLGNALKRKPAKQKWVIMADGQPATSMQRERVTGLIADIAAKHPDAFATIYAGDIAHRGNVPTGDGWWSEAPILYDTLLRDLEALPTPKSRTFYIAGNHDINYGSGGVPEEFTWNEFLKWFDRHFYHVKMGNILFVFMSPMSRATGGHIADYVVDWWKELVRCHQDCVIVNVTHHPIQNTTAGSTTSGGSLIGSSRFTDILTSAAFKSDLWFSGHTGGNFNDPEIVGHGDWFNCHFIGVDMNSGAFDAETGFPDYPASYVTMEFTEGSDTVEFHRWAVGQPSPSKSWTKVVKRPLQLTEVIEFDGRTAFDPKHGIVQGPIKQAYNIPKQVAAGAVVQNTTPAWIYEAILEDRLNQDVNAGSGGGFLVHVPGSDIGGGASEISPDLNHAYGVGAGWAAERQSDNDTDYSAGFSIYASTAGKNYDSLRRSITFRADHARLEWTDYSFRMAHSNAGEHGVNFAQSTGGVSCAIMPRGEGGTTGWNSAFAIMGIGRTAAGRSINAGGTINASGADYAEYREVKPHLYGAVTKGAMLGVAADGLLTDRWSKVVGRVFFKSTNPNLVGNDGWGTEDALFIKYGVEPVGEEPVIEAMPPFRFPDGPDLPEGPLTPEQEAALLIYNEEREAALAEWKAELAMRETQVEEARAARERRRAIMADVLEQERIKYDRIAFCGVVPTLINATTEDVGKYVVPIEGPEDGIACKLVPKAELTLADYIDSCGIVDTVEGSRTFVLIKVG